MQTRTCIEDLAASDPLIPTTVTLNPPDEAPLVRTNDDTVAPAYDNANTKLVAPDIVATNAPLDA